DTLFAFGIGLLIYFVIAYLLTLGMNLLEARAKHKLGRGPSMREVLRLAPDKSLDTVAAPDRRKVAP
ncbi:hypothetical protein ACWDU1_28735, partial [Nocardia sp. NPDC003345]